MRRTGRGAVGLSLAVGALVAGGTGAGAATVTGTDGPDRLEGTAQADVIRGLAGDDFVAGLGADDELYGDGGADLLHGGPGLDLVVGGPGADLLYGEGGNDTLSANSSDLAHGGPGDDVVRVPNGHPAVYGDAGDDTVRGGPATDGLLVWAGLGDDHVAEQSPPPSEPALRGGAGVDVLESHDGDALLIGGPDADTFLVGDSSATVFGGDGDDVVQAAGADRNRVHCGAGVDTVEADALDAVDADCESVTRS